jgi:uncharacterized integral membrane protein
VADTLVNKTVNRLKQLSTRTIVTIVIAVVALIFIFQNTQDSQVHLLFWDIHRPLWLWLLLVFAAGFLVGSMFPWFNRRRKPASSTDTSKQ